MFCMDNNDHSKFFFFFFFLNAVTSVQQDSFMMVENSHDESRKFPCSFNACYSHKDK